MSKHERIARIEGIDLDTGTFPMTLASEGEASDGDILSIKGGQIPERMPMLASHWNNPSAQLGSITDPQKLLKDSPPRLRVIGHIEMGGEGVSAEIRRDLAYMIDKGHVTGASIRWDDIPGKSVRRVNLPSDHPYFVDEATEKDFRKRYGVFYEEWKALEGSIVALGADPQALIGRAEETEGAVSTFWRAMADDANCRIWRDVREQHPDAEVNSIFIDRGEEVEGAERFVRVPLPADESPEAKIAASLAGLRIDALDCHEAGATHADLINAVVDGSDEDFSAVEFDDCVIFLPATQADQLRARLEVKPAPDQASAQREPDQDPAPEVNADQPSPLTLDVSEVTNPIDVEEFTEAFSAALDAADERHAQFMKDLIELAQGRI